MSEFLCERGFVTLATGEKRYYELAANLLKSYRMNCSNPYPFAIIADKKNEYTSLFDHVVMISDPTCTFMDKLRLYELMPYKETIFIDSDSLAFGDLNEWFSLFENAGDFAAFGYAKTDFSNKKQFGWFEYEGMREFKERIKFIPSFNGGVYYLRKTETCRQVFETAKYAAVNWEKYSFNGFKDPADEPVLALGMAVNNCPPVSGGWGTELLFAPSKKTLHIDIVNSKADYILEGKYVEPRLIHWGNYKTRKALYRFETQKMNLYLANGESFLYKMLYKSRLLYYILLPQDLLVFGGRVIRKMKRVISAKINH